MAKKTYDHLPSHMRALPEPRERSDTATPEALDLGDVVTAKTIGFRTRAEAQAAAAAGLIPCITGAHLRTLMPILPAMIKDRVYACSDLARWQPPAVDLTAHAAVPTAKGIRFMPTSVRMPSIVGKDKHEEAAKQACESIKASLAEHRIKPSGPVRLSWLTSGQAVRLVEYRDLASGALVAPTKDTDLEQAVGETVLLPPVTIDQLRSEVFAHLQNEISAGRGQGIGIGLAAGNAGFAKDAKASVASNANPSPNTGSDARAAPSDVPATAPGKPTAAGSPATHTSPAVRPQIAPPVAASAVVRAPLPTPGAGAPSNQQPINAQPTAQAPATPGSPSTAPAQAIPPGERMFAPETTVDTSAAVTPDTAHAILLLRRGETVDQALGRLVEGACPTYIGMANQVRHRASGKGTGYLQDGSRIFLAQIDTRRVTRGADAIAATVLGHVAWNGTGKDINTPTVWRVGADPATFTKIEGSPVINVAGLSADKIAAAVGPHMADKPAKVATWRSLQAHAGFALGAEHTKALAVDAWVAADPDFGKPSRDRLDQELAARALTLAKGDQGLHCVCAKSGESYHIAEVYSTEQLAHFATILRGPGESGKDLFRDNSGQGR